MSHHGHHQWQPTSANDTKLAQISTEKLTVDTRPFGADCVPQHNSEDAAATKLSIPLCPLNYLLISLPVIDVQSEKSHLPLLSKNTATEGYHG